jgi:hypothetical protein
MKKLFVIAAIALVAIVVALSGCAQGKTYAYDISSDFGYCMEVTTNNADVQESLIQSDFQEGTCPSDSVIGKCTYTSTYGTETATVNQYYYSGSIIDEAYAKSQCDSYNGTWEAQ